MHFGIFQTKIHVGKAVGLIYSDQKKVGDFSSPHVVYLPPPVVFPFVFISWGHVAERRGVHFLT